MMKPLNSRNEDHNIYLTEADCSIESTSHTTPNDLLKNLKLFSLLGEHVVLAAAHIFESDSTFTLLSRDPLLLETGIVVVDLRDDCRDFSDFVDFQRSNKPHDRIWQQKRIEEIAGFLNLKCPYVLKWSPQREEGLFRSLLVEALSVKESTLRKRMIGVKTVNIAEAISQIKDVSRITRSFLKTLADDLFPTRVRVFLEEVNAAYYLAGAKDMNLIPALHPAYFNKCQNGLEHIRHDRYCQEILREFFSNMLTTNGLDRDLVSLLTMDGINSIRQEGIVTHFRNSWWRILSNPQNFEGASVIGEYEREVVRCIQEKVHAEQHRTTTFAKARRTIGLCSLVASGLSVLPNPILALISFALALVTYDPIAEKIGDAFIHRELSAICARINAAYTVQNC